MLFVTGLGRGFGELRLVASRRVLGVAAAWRRKMIDGYGAEQAQTKNPRETKGVGSHHVRLLL
jgi:hypothetical protein